MCERNVDMDDVLFCMVGRDETAPKRISSLVATNYGASVQLHAKLRPIEHIGNQKFQLRYGGDRGQNAMHTFHIPKISSIDMWRLKLRAHHSTSESPTTRIFVFPESSPCISTFASDGGCIDSVLLWNCLKSVHVSFRRPDPLENVKVSLHLSFKTQATLTLSRGSIPALQEGTWVIFVTCGLVKCPATTLEVEMFQESDARLKLAYGGCIVFLGTLSALLLVNAIYAVAYACLYRCTPEDESRPSHEKGLWPVIVGRCTAEHWEMLCIKLEGVRQPLPFFPTLLTLMLGVFMATTAQFVITHYGLMIRTGNRDICFFNERCYYPGKFLDLPWNNIISNFAYVVAGFNIALQAFFAETRCHFFSRQSIRALFKDMDLKGKGRLNVADWRELFQKADLNGNETVSRTEWIDS